VLSDRRAAMFDFSKIEDVLDLSYFSDQGYPSDLRAGIKLQPNWLNLAVFSIDQADNERNQVVNSRTPPVQELASPGRMTGHQRFSVFIKDENVAYATPCFRR